MDESVKKIKKLALLMKKEGILLLKTPEIELQLAPSALIDQTPEHQSDSLPREQPPIPDAYSAEQILMWSAPGLELPTEN